MTSPASRQRGRTSDIPAIENDDHLIRYAAQAQIALLNKRKLPNRAVAEAMGVAAPNLSAALRRAPTPSRLPKFDGAIMALAPELARTGGLVAFRARLAGREGPANVSASVPPVWTDDLLREEHRGPVGVLIQASALLSALIAAGGEEASRLVRDKYQVELRRVVDQLILIGISPPSPHSIEALILLGSIASYAFDDVVRGSLGKALKDSPFGFRVWRGVTSIVHAYQGNKHPAPPASVRDWVRWQLRAWKQRRTDSIYPARSLDLEAVIAVPADWSPAEDDWAGDILRARARMDGPDGATVRERATAALGLWERAFGHGDVARAGAGREVGELAARFRAEAEDRHTVARTGLRWTADTIDHVVRSGQMVCNAWPEDSPEPCLRVVREVGRGLDVPPGILEATQRLFEQAVLQNAGVYRRRAIDAIRAGGWAEEATNGLARILAHEEAEPWLRCRVLFALGFLQERGEGVQMALQDGYERARLGLQTAEEPSRDLVSEMHAAVFAVGDCFGVPRAEDAAGNVRDALDPTLLDLALSCTTPRMLPVPRAAAYLMTVTARADDQALLKRLAEHEDPVTRKACEWALATRFDDAGGVRPFHLGA